MWLATKVCEEIEQMFSTPWQHTERTSYTDRTLKCRIATDIPVEEVVRLLAVNFKANEPASTLALRNERDELVTDETLVLAVGQKLGLKRVG
jgi:hypothetical protein